MKHYLTCAALLATSWAFGQDGCCALMDYDGDRNVSISDFTIFLSTYGVDDVVGYTGCMPCYTAVVFDADQQGEIGLSDLLIMLSLFGATDVDFDLIWDSVDMCFDINSCNFMDALADECIYPDVFGICGGQCFSDNDQDGICDDEDGCSDSNACNFINPSSIECIYEDALGICGGSCELDIDSDFRCDDIDNCTDVEACNYSNPAVCDCSYEETAGGCFDPGDIDGDGICDFQDDCVDVESCNYAAYPTAPCVYDDIDSDGICDDIDTCIGVEDECGCCNGPGPTEVVIDDITILYDSVYDEQIDDWFVFEVGQDTTFSYICAPLFSACGDLVDYQGYDYATVLIGNQCWFAENLRNENYDNCDAIPANLNDSLWQTTNSGAVAVYGEDPWCNNYSAEIDACDPAQSLEEYGRLYNWYAVDDARGLCPSGWHVPTDEEWTVMVDHLGGESVAGVQMKTDFGWGNGGNGTNSSDFSGLPGGLRLINTVFNYAGVRGVWWSSSPVGTHAWFRQLSDEDDIVARGNNHARSGLSVRCVRDAE